MFDGLKFFLQKLFSSKFIVGGKCKMCGTCCRNIVFYIGKKIISDEKEFDNLRKFDKKYNNFEINGRGEEGELLFKCKALAEDGKCSVYKWRSVNCRLYPRVKQDFVYKGGVTLDGCGYYFEVDKKFKDYIKKDNP